MLKLPKLTAELQSSRSEMLQTTFLVWYFM